MRIGIVESVHDFAGEILEIRSDIHRHPELGNSEFMTASLIENRLDKAGIETKRLLDTAVIGILRGSGEGKTIALRADMDALPIAEQTGAYFASEVLGVMHACGHDVHTAAAVGTALILSSQRERINGNVVFLFQPDEEGDGGALRLIKHGVLDGVDAVFGAHVSPDIPEGCVGVRYGKFYAAADVFDVSVTGKGAHAAEPESGIDALAAAAEMVTEIGELQNLFLPERCVLTTGTFTSGTARNILAENASFSGIVRSFGEDSRRLIEKAFRETIKKKEREKGVTAEVGYRHGYPGIINDDEMTELVRKAASELLGEESVFVIKEPTMKTEDFGYYSEEIPGTFYHIGAGCHHPLHSPQFLPSDKAVLTAAAVNTAVILKYLGSDI